MTADWVEPDDWMDWPRMIAEEHGLDLDAPIKDIYGDWRRPSPKDAMQRMLTLSCHLAKRNNALKEDPDNWHPEQDSNLLIWKAAVAHLPSKVFPTYTRGVHDDICTHTSSMIWKIIQDYDKHREPITISLMFRRAIAAAKHEMQRGLKVPVELWGDVCQHSEVVKTQSLFTNRPDWIALKKDGDRRFDSVVDDLVYTWEAMLGLVGRSRAEYSDESSRVIRHRKSYRKVVLSCINLRKKWESWQEDPRKN